MKLKSVLLASVAVLFAGSASAADLTSPFFVPSQGKMTSDTKVEYGRTHVDDGIDDSLYASEELAYGITNNFAVFGTIGNHFDIEKEFNNSHNFDYEIGAKYNHNFGNVKTQVSGSYYTFNPKSWYGHRTDARCREFLQSAFMGVHKYAVKWAADAGIRYDFNTDGHNNNGVYAQAEVDYYAMDNLALGVYGDYKLGGKINYYDEEVGTDYTVGLRAKVMF